MMTPEKPNILFILADDLGWGDVSYHGSHIRTPNIDRLAARGVELDQHYVCPMCTPTRVCLLTGRHPGRFGRHATVPSNAPVLPDGYRTLATMLRHCGYDTALFGKWHLGSDPEFRPNNYGFDTSYGSLAGGVDPYNHRYKMGPHSMTWHRNGELFEERGHVTDLIVREAAAWIEARQGPWFCYVPFTAVHTPIKAPQAWIDTYFGGTYDEDPDRDRSFKVYAAYASHMDWAVGQLVEALERTCQREDTIIVFTSDNGAIPENPIHDTDRYPGRQEDMPRLGSNLPLRGQKAQLYEGGIRTPSLINWPAGLRPRKLEHPLHMVDWMPTIAGLLDHEPEDDPRWDGKDVWRLLQGEVNAVEREAIFWNFGGHSFAARQEDWKLITNGEMDPRGAELYDLGSDPCEKEDLAGGNRERVNDLMEIIAAERGLDDTSRRDDAE